MFISFLLVWANLLHLVFLSSSIIPQHIIYVDPSGVSGPFCWYGGSNSPCLSLDTALQGAVQQSMNTTIYVSPGVYLFNSSINALMLEPRSEYSVSVIGITESSNNITRKVSVVTLREFSYTAYNLECMNLYQSGVIPPIIFPCYPQENCLPDGTISDDELMIQFENPSQSDRNSYEFKLSILNSLTDCYNRSINVNVNQVRVCIISATIRGNILDDSAVYTQSFGHNCSYVALKLPNMEGDIKLGINENYDIWDDPVMVNLSVTTTVKSTNITSFGSVTLLPCLGKELFTDYDSNGSIVCFNEQNGLIDCGPDVDDYQLKPGYCIYDKQLLRCPLYYGTFETFHSSKILMNTSDLFCANNRTGKLCGSCFPRTGVPINIINVCSVECNQNYKFGAIVFVLIELLPITVIVYLIIVFNIQLTNGSIAGLVFYSQILTTVYPGLALNVIVMHYSEGFILNDYCRYYSSGFNSFYNNFDYFYYHFWLLFTIPCNIFNLDFTPFLGYNTPICITPNMGPLGAISFWYVVALYPLLLLFFIYLWLVMYYKGFKCVGLITRPFHRCLARFWNKIKIEPSLTQSSGSIYLLCFNQLISVSLKLLHSTNDFSSFYYDASIPYFKKGHTPAAIAAILILITLVILPYIFIQLYPLKLFHKLLTILHLNKPLLISLGDVFTGPYKNGLNNLFDYRYFAGFYLLVRIFIVLLHFVPFDFNIITGFSQLSLLALCGGSIMILRPYKANIHNLIEFSLFLLLISFNIATLVIFGSIGSAFFILITNGLIFFIIIPIYLTVKIVKSCHTCNKENKSRQLLSITTSTTATTDSQQLETEFMLVENDWQLPDRMENPENYQEQHVQITEDDARFVI